MARLQDPAAPLPQVPQAIREQLEVPAAVLRRSREAVRGFVKVLPLERRDAGTGLGAARAAGAAGTGLGVSSTLGEAAGLLGRKRGAAEMLSADSASSGATTGEQVGGEGGRKRAKVLEEDAAGNAMMELVGLGGAVTEQ